MLTQYFPVHLQQGASLLHQGNAATVAFTAAVAAAAFEQHSGHDLKLVDDNNDQPPKLPTIHPTWITTHLYTTLHV